MAARNLLLDSNYSVKIADFGLARYIHDDDIYIVQHNKRLPVKWMSMEALSDATFSVSSDVWVEYRAMSLRFLFNSCRGLTLYNRVCNVSMVCVTKYSAETDFLFLDQTNSKRLSDKKLCENVH